MDKILLNENFENNIYIIPSEFEGINLELKSKNISYDILLQTKKNIIPKKFDKISKVYDHIKQKESDELWKEAKNLKQFSYYKNPYWNFQNIINPYYFVNFTKDLWKLYNKHNEYFKQFQEIYENIEKKYQRIELYDNITTITYFSSWEIYKNYPYINNNKKLKSLFIFNQLVISSLEEFCLYREKYSRYSYQDRIDALEIKNFLLGSQLETPDDIRKTFKNKYNHVNYDVSDIDICHPDIFNKMNNKIKYDIVEITGVMFDFKVKYLTEYKNTQLLFNYILLTFQFLKVDGNFKITIRENDLKLTSDILFLLTQYFENVYCVKTSSSGITRPYKYIICIGFKGISKNKKNELLTINKKWYELDNTCGRDLEQEEKKREYVHSIITFKKEPSMFYKLIKYFNTIFTMRNDNLWRKLIYQYHRFYKYRNNSKKLEELDDSIRKLQLKHSIEWLKKYDLQVKHKYDIEDITKQTIQENLVSYKNPIKYTFKYHGETLLQNVDVNKKYSYTENKKLSTYEKRLSHAKRIIDTRNLDKYYNITREINVYSKLKNYIREKYTEHNTTRAFIKLYEILWTYNLLDKRKTTHSTFHACEFPGQFIISTNHYLKTKTNNTTFHWKAQSLNPKSKENIKKYGKDIFIDSYNLMKNYPTYWVFGKDNTGDITNTKNIKYYKKYTENIDLITFDCGLRSDTPHDMLYQQNKLAKIHYSCILFILHNLPLEKNFVFKIFLPMTIPYIISCIYILYCSFEELSFYKPIVHQGSSEFYIIGKNFIGIHDTILNYLFDKKNSLDIEYGIIPQESISFEFMKQYEKIIGKLTEDNISTIMRSIYYYDNPDELKEYEKYINKLKKDRVHEWIKKYTFEKINKNDRIIK